MLHCRWAYLQAWRRAVLIVALKVLDLTTSRTPTAERSRPPAQAATHPRCSQDGGAGGRGGLGGDGTGGGGLGGLGDGVHMALIGSSHMYGLQGGKGRGQGKPPSLSAHVINA